MSSALIYGLATACINIMWYYAGTAAFLDTLRIKRSLFYMLMVAIALLIGFLNFYFPAFMPDERVIYQTIVPLIQYALLALLLLSVFRIFPGKLLCVFLIIFSVSTGINYLAYLIHLLLLLPGTPINYGKSISYILTILLGNALAIPFFIRFCKKSLRKTFDMNSHADVLKLCITPILFFIISQLVSSIGFRNAISAGNPSDTLLVSAVYLLIIMTGLLTHYVSLRLIITNVNRTQLMVEKDALERQLTIQSRSYEQLAEYIDQMRIIRHDIRHHLSVMNGYLSSGELHRLKTYMEEYSNYLPADAEPILCENHTVDVIVRHYLAQARSKGARIDVKIVLPEDAGIPDVDLSVVFGNIFENALKSILSQEEGERFIQSRCERVPGKIILTVDNSIGKPSKKGEAGIGLQSVQTIARKYNGSTRFSSNGKVYQSAVILHTR